MGSRRRVVFVSKVPYVSVSLVFGRTCPGLRSTERQGSARFCSEFGFRMHFLPSDIYQLLASPSLPTYAHTPLARCRPHNIMGYSTLNGMLGGTGCEVSWFIVYSAVVETGRSAAIVARRESEVCS
jgi:hypothetical protein